MMYVVGIHLNCLIEALLMSAYNICRGASNEYPYFNGEIRIITSGYFSYLELWQVSLHILKLV